MTTVNVVKSDDMILGHDLFEIKTSKGFQFHIRSSHWALLDWALSKMGTAGVPTISKRQYFNGTFWKQIFLE